MERLLARLRGATVWSASSTFSQERELILLELEIFSSEETEIAAAGGRAENNFFGLTDQRQFRRFKLVMHSIHLLPSLVFENSFCLCDPKARFGTALLLALLLAVPQPQFQQDHLLQLRRKSYQDFLNIWKDADSDIPILKQAKVEFAKLR
jgi:hypothetical protein